ncbi:MAG TPA: hypothetical protein VKV20_06810 [Ktedonobacteraceae bacterium]|jgi:hypothetical protein|nr:hypothetical protein [Ktedonobacteraceae bacterium]
MRKIHRSTLTKLFFLVLIIDAVLVLILAGLVLNAFVARTGLTPELIAWVAGYISFMIVSSIVLFVLVIVTVSIRMKDAQHYEEIQRRRREMDLKRRADL